jgi:acetyl-CoA synthetase
MNEIIMEKNNKVLPILKDYEKERIEFNWENIEKQLFPNGLVNPAYLAIYKDIEKFGNNIGLIWIGKDEVKRFTYNDLAINGSRVANGLRNNGFKSGDRIVLFSRKVPELYFTMIGATLAGGILVPVFQSFGIEALRYRIENSRARFILTHKELLDKVKSAISGLDVKVITIEDNFDEFLGSTDIHIEMKRAHEPWFIIYTSGSTGKPKGIIQSQRTIALYYISGLYHFDLQDDVFWPTGDPAWVAGYASVWTGWLRRVPLISLESKFNAEKWLSIIEEFKVSVWSTAPTALRLLKKN